MRCTNSIISKRIQTHKLYNRDFINNLINNHTTNIELLGYDDDNYRVVLEFNTYIDKYSKEVIVQEALSKMLPEYEKGIIIPGIFFEMIHLNNRVSEVYL